MDAKPQRPARSRTFRDENLPPVLPQGKTIHLRNKSSPALSSLAAAQGMKAGPRRTAFADVSNTARTRLARDDSTIPQKPLSILKEQPDDAAALQKPAQRPLSVSTIRGFFNNIAANAAPKQPVVEEKQDIAPAVPTLIQKTLTRKPAPALKDLEHPLPELPLYQPQAQSVLPSALLRKKASIYVDAEEARPVTQPAPTTQDPQIPAPGSNSSEYHDVRSDGVSLLTSADVPLPQMVDYDPLASDDFYEHVAAQPPLDPIAAKPLERQYPDKPLGRHDSAQVSSMKEPSAERWPDEPYADYEEDDYTTARSLKSRGETTTGPTTIVLAPTTTADVELELAAAKQFVEDSPEAAELEEDEQWDTSMVAEYGEEIFSYMRVLEEQMRPNPYYMDNQTEVQWSMRSVLMDWLVQVHHRFSLLPETLFLCVNYIDRFLSCKVVSLAKLQLVGATAIFVAAKYEEINCPSVQEIVYMVDGGYTVDEILKAERFMLSMLQFELGWPGPMSFLRRISKADDYDLETRTLAKYFLEITIMDERFVGCIPSYTAAGAHCLSRLMLKKGLWSQKHVHYSGYTYSQLRPLLFAVLSCCDEAHKHHAAVFDKYGDKRFKRASFFVQTEMDKGFVLPDVPQIGLLSDSEHGLKW